MTALLSLRGLTKIFSTETDSPPVLNGIDLDIQAGESLAIVGPSGCGKSTLLSIIGALLPASSGSVAFEGVDLSSLDADQLAELRNQKIGFVFQDHHLLPQCTALENALLPTLVHPDKTKRAASETRAKELLEQVGLADRATHRPAQLSGGERQRVAVVRALINEPPLLLADEPTGSLDTEAAAKLGELLRKLNADCGVAVVTVTHSLELAAQMQITYELRGGILSQR